MNPSAGDEEAAGCDDVCNTIITQREREVRSKDCTRGKNGRVNEATVPNKETNFCENNIAHHNYVIDSAQYIATTTQA